MNLTQNVKTSKTQQKSQRFLDCSRKYGFETIDIRTIEIRECVQEQLRCIQLRIGPWRLEKMRLRQLNWIAISLLNGTNDIW